MNTNFEQRSITNSLSDKQKDLKYKSCNYSRFVQRFGIRKIGELYGTSPIVLLVTI